MDKKISETLDKIYQLSQQNVEFDLELRKRLNITPTKSILSDDERLNQIYEYCIEKIIRKQANEFYHDFPLSSIKSQLVEDYVKMEFFHRKDNFEDFSFSLYQQIECITNRLCENATLEEITNKMWGDSAYIKVEKDEELSISNRIGEYNIASLVFPGQNKETGLPYSLEKSKVTLQSQYANDKIRIIVYFIGYKAMMKNSDYDSYKEITSLLSDIYQCRNMNHRGNTPSQYEIDTYNRIIPLKSFYYFKFLGALAQYIEYIKEGFSFLSSIKEYCNTFSAKKVSIDNRLKIVGKIDLKVDGRKRFK